MLSTNISTDPTPSAVASQGCPRSSCSLTSMFARGVDRGERGPRLVARFLGFELGHAVGDDAGSSGHFEAVTRQDDGANRNGEIEIAAASHVTDGPAVSAARARFELANDLHRPHFGGAGERT